MAPSVIQRDIVVHQAATFVDEFSWLVDGIPQALTGFSAVLSIATRYGPAPAITVTSEDSEIVLEPMGQKGVIRVIIPDTKTAVLVRDGVYDLLVVDPRVTPRIVSRVAQGAVKLIPGVTRLEAS